jgi:hypothetical protein
MKSAEKKREKSGKPHAQLSFLATTQAIHFSNAKRAIPSPFGGKE